MPDERITPDETPVAKPKNEKEAVRLWHDRISVSLRHRDRIADEKRWQVFIDEYNGKYDVLLGDMVVPAINEVYAFMQAFISFIAFKNPHITVNPTKTGTVRGARINELILNRDWRELDMGDQSELEILDAGLIGHGWNKVGNAKKTLSRHSPLKEADYKLYSNRVSWKDILTNIGSEDPPHDCLWMAQRIIRPLEYFKDKYPKTSGSMKGTKHPRLSKDEHEKAMFKDDILFGVAWEIWDGENKKVYLVGEGVEVYLKEMAWPDYLDEYPYQRLWFSRAPDDPYPVSQIAPWEPQLLEKIKLFTQALNHAKRWNRQAFAKKGVVAPEEWSKYEKGIDGSIIEHTSADIRRDLMFADYGSLSPDFYALLDRLSQLINSVSGQPEFQRGGQTKTQSRTLGELKFLREGAEGLTQRKVVRFERHIQNIARHMLAHRQNGMTVEEVVKITGDTPQAVVQAFGQNFNPLTGEIRFSKEDIKGEYDITVKAGSTLPQDREGKIQILGSIMKNMAGLAVQGVTSPFLNELVREQLQEFEMKGLEAAFEKEAQAAAQKAQEAKQTKGLGDAKTASEMQKRQAQAGLIETQTAVAEEELKGAAQERQMAVIDAVFPGEGGESK